MKAIDLTIDADLLQHVKEAQRMSEDGFVLAVVRDESGSGVEGGWTLTLLPADVAESMIVSKEAAYCAIQKEEILVYPEALASSLERKHMKWSSQSVEIVSRA